MPGDEDNAITDQLLSDSDCLLRIAGIVRRVELHLLAKHTARRVDVGHGQPRAPLHLLAVPGVLSRHRTCDCDQHLRPSRVTDDGCEHDEYYGDETAHGLCAS